MTIKVSTTPFPNESYCDPQTTDCGVQATLEFQSSDSVSCTCISWIDNKEVPVFDGQSSDGRFTVTTTGNSFALMASIGAGTTIVISVQGAQGKGTNGHINVGSGSGDSFQHTR